MCENLFKALDETRDYLTLLLGFKNFYRDGKYAIGDLLNAMIPHPIGIEAVGMYAWDKINPLLEKADNILKEMGVDTKNFGL